MAPNLAALQHDLIRDMTVGELLTIYFAGYSEQKLLECSRWNYPEHAGTTYW